MYKIELNRFQLQRVTSALDMARQYFVDVANEELDLVQSDKYMFIADEYCDVFDDIVKQKAAQDNIDTTTNTNQ